jgi:hypothetical protein
MWEGTSGNFSSIKDASDLHSTERFQLYRVGVGKIPEVMGIWEYSLTPLLSITSQAPKEQTS